MKTFILFFFDYFSGPVPLRHANNNALTRLTTDHFLNPFHYFELAMAAMKSLEATPLASSITLFYYIVQ